jgi:hypothetical protein
LRDEEVVDQVERYRTVRGLSAALEITRQTVSVVLERRGGEEATADLGR